MNEILNDIKKIAEDTGYYSVEFWEQLQHLNDQRKEELSEFILHYLSSIKKVNIDFKECQIVLAITQGVYPFANHQINDLSRSFVHTIEELSKIEESNEVSNRDYLLYLIMDILFHYAEIITEAENQTRKDLFKAIIGIGKLKYKVNKIDGDSYFKNYKVIQFFTYFEESEWRQELINLYLNHFDSRLRKDMQNEIDDQEY